MEDKPFSKRGLQPNIAIMVTAISLILAIIFYTAPSTSTQAYSQNPAEIFINEIHYNNVDPDKDEFVELMGPADTNLYGWEVILYDGLTGQVYQTVPFSSLTKFPNQSNGMGTVKVMFSPPVDDGSPDGVALVNGSTVVQFLSYRGQFRATNGPAENVESTEIAPNEDNNTPVGTSIQLRGTGRVYQDFTWAASSPASFGAINTGQTISAASADSPPSIVSTVPDQFATNVDQAAPVIITFSEPVFVSEYSFNISCQSPLRAIIYTIGQNSTGNIVTLYHSALFNINETCVVTVYSSRVRDRDTNDPPNGMDMNYIFSFTVSAVQSSITPSSTPTFTATSTPMPTNTPTHTRTPTSTSTSTSTAATSSPTATSTATSSTTSTVTTTSSASSSPTSSTTSTTTPTMIGTSSPTSSTTSTTTPTMIGTSSPTSSTTSTTTPTMIGTSSPTSSATSTIAPTSSPTHTSTSITSTATVTVAPERKFVLYLPHIKK